MDIINTLDLLKSRFLKNELFDWKEYVRKSFELDESFDDVVSFIIDKKIASRNEVMRVISKIKSEEVIKERTLELLGLDIVPTTPRQLVNSVTKSRNAFMRLDGIYAYDRYVDFDGTKVSIKEAESEVDNRTFADLQTMNQDNQNITTIMRELQLSCEEIGLDFKNESITKACEEWAERSVASRRVTFFDIIRYDETKNKVELARREDMWEKMVDIYFSDTKQDKKVIIQVFKKFMHQVKGKGARLKINNHLCPVITGPIQGFGKSSIIRDMMGFMPDAVREIDFSVLTDGKTVDIYESPVLFLDEMANADRADINTIKTRITSEVVGGIRVMRTNMSPTVRQGSTFIGTSNSCLEEVVYDSSGVRRFYEIMMDKPALYHRKNEVDWVLLWKSVDELGVDPLECVWDEVKMQQEANRAKTPLECWMNDSVSNKHHDFSSAGQMYGYFKMYMEEYFKTSTVPSIKKFSMLLSKEIERSGATNWEMRDYNNRKEYRKVVMDES